MLDPRGPRAASLPASGRASAACPGIPSRCPRCRPAVRGSCPVRSRPCPGSVVLGGCRVPPPPLAPLPGPSPAPSGSGTRSIPGGLFPKACQSEHTPALWPLLVLPAPADPALSRPVYGCGVRVTEMLQGSPSCVWCQSGSTLRASGFCCVCRKHLQEIPSSSTNVSTSLEWDPGKTSELLSGMGVSALKKDKLGNENTPQDLLVSSPCLPPKRQKVKENEKDFVIVRRPWLLREAESGISLDALPDELLLAIFAYLPLKDLLKVSMICKRWHRLSFDESLWQTLDLTGGNLLPGVLGQLLPAGVTVFRCPRSCIGDPLFKTSNLLKIQHLDLSNCTVSVADLHSILCLCEKLQNLSLEGLVLSDGIIKLEELNLSWCEFTATHVKAAVNHVTSKITQLNLSGYRENLQIADVKTLVERCPLLVHLDLSDSMMLKPECFQYFKQLVFLQHLCLSRCYQISPAALVELGEIRTLKTLRVFGIVTDSSLQLLEEALPDMKINGSHFTSIARPTVGNKKSHEIWGIKCRLTLRNPSFV